jgi:hypothetical protein
LARTAFEFATKTDGPILRAEVLSELASVHEAAGRFDEARAAITEAVDLFIAKGDVVSAERAKKWAREQVPGPIA